MKKALVLGALATLGALSFGCALTDYPAIPALDKSHGVIGCHTDDRFANDQQTIEVETRNLVYSRRDPANPAAALCPVFGPALTNTNVSGADAKDWNRFNAAWVFLGETQVFSPASLAGTYCLSGVKDLADGSRRINSYFSPNVGNFTCVGAAVDGVYGGPEGKIVGDALVNPGQTAARIPGLRLDTVAVDNGNGTEFCANIAAADPSRGNSASSYSTFWAFTGRSAEGRLYFTPITRRDGLQPFLNGADMTVNVQGIAITGSGHLNADGTVDLTLKKLEGNGALYQAGDQPVVIRVNPGHGRTYEVHAPAIHELVGLAQFAIDANLVNRTISLQGTQVQELGLTAPPVALTLVGQTLQDFINAHAGQIDG